MRLIDRITAEGRRLFRLRSYVPLALLPALYVALIQMAQFEQRWGQHVEDLWLACCVCISGLGLLLRAFTVGFVPGGTSGRARGAPGASVLNTLGMYSVVRNPLYLANGLMWLGVALGTTSGWFVAFGVLFYWLYIERVIAAEEAYLVERFGDEYRRWAEQTPCFLPNLSLWHRPAMGFSLRTALRRESSGLISLAAAFTLIDFLSDTLLQGEPVTRWIVTDWQWVLFLGVALLLGGSLQVLKKMHWLSVSGR